VLYASAQCLSQTATSYLRRLPVLILALFWHLILRLAPLSRRDWSEMHRAASFRRGVAPSLRFCSPSTASLSTTAANQTKRPRSLSAPFLGESMCICCLSPRPNDAPRWPAKSCRLICADRGRCSVRVSQQSCACRPTAHPPFSACPLSRTLQTFKWLPRTRLRSTQSSRPGLLVCCQTAERLSLFKASASCQVLAALQGVVYSPLKTYFNYRSSEVTCTGQISPSRRFPPRAHSISAPSPQPSVTNIDAFRPDFAIRLANYQAPASINCAHVTQYPRSSPLPMLPTHYRRFGFAFQAPRERQQESVGLFGAMAKLLDVGNQTGG